MDVPFQTHDCGNFVYVKVILRNDCVVVSFHEDKSEGHDDEDA